MIIIEIQHSNDGTNATIVNSYKDQATAEQKYHTVLAAAAVSNVDVHSAVMLDDMGNHIKGESYYHGSLE
jgi:hypothetical protein